MKAIFDTHDNDDEELWNKLDELMKVVRGPLDEFLACLYQYHDNIGLEGQAILFGGIGKIVMNYNHLISNHSPEESLAMSIQDSHRDRRVQQLMGISVETAIDEKVKKMKGD